MSITLREFLPYARKWGFREPDLIFLETLPENTPFKILWDTADHPRFLRWVLDRVGYNTHEAVSIYNKRLQKEEIKGVRTHKNEHGKTLLDVLPPEGQIFVDQFDLWLDGLQSDVELDGYLLEVRNKYLNLYEQLFALNYLFTIARRGDAPDFNWTGKEVLQAEADSIRNLIRYDDVEPLREFILGMAEE